MVQVLDGLILAAPHPRALPPCTGPLASGPARLRLLALVRPHVGGGAFG
ncbi:MAG: hypothetical protein WC378_12900 [Opitutaceae bacterium]